MKAEFSKLSSSFYGSAYMYQAAWCRRCTSWSALCAKVRASVVHRIRIHTIDYFARSTVNPFPGNQTDSMKGNHQTNEDSSAYGFRFHSNLQIFWVLVPGNKVWICFYSGAGQDQPRHRSTTTQHQSTRPYQVYNPSFTAHLYFTLFTVWLLKGQRRHGETQVSAGLIYTLQLCPSYPSLPLLTGM